MPRIWNTHRGVQQRRTRLLLLFFFAAYASGFTQQERREPKALNFEAVRKSVRVPDYLLWGGFNSRLAVQVLVDENGQVMEVVIPGRCDFFLGWQMSKAARHLQFEPAVIDGQPIKAWVTFPVFFMHNELVDVMPAPAPPPDPEAPFDPNEVKLLDRSGQYKKEIGDDAFRFPSIESVWLQNNELESLPERICEWKKLKVLCLQGNKLSELPACIGEMKSLEFLFLGDNPDLKADRGQLQSQLPNTVIVWDRAFENPPK